jgi:butyrate kinase
MPDMLILAVNLGGTSSKFALYNGAECLAECSIPVAGADVKLPLADQRPKRLLHLREFLAAEAVDLTSLAAIAARGGLMKQLSRRGVYRVGKAMLDDLAGEKYGSHPSNLSSPIAYDLLEQEQLETPLFVVDPITIDTLADEARISGVPGIERAGRLHALNVFRAVRRAAEMLGAPVHECDFVVGHFGSGVSICTISGGRCIDVNDAQLGEGPFAMTRAGTLPLRRVLDLAYGEPERGKLERMLSREAGLSAYTGTADFREVEQKLSAGDAQALAAYSAMVFQSAKYIAAHAGSLGHPPDAVVLTGGLVQSERFAGDLTARVEWLAPVITLAGEDEMAALAEGVHRALTGLEPVLEYTEVPGPADAPPRTMEEVVGRATKGTDCSFIFVGGHHPEVAETVRHCHEHGISGFTLIGPEDEMVAQLAEEGVSMDNVELVDSTDVVADAMSRAQAQPGSVLVKGKCDTSALFKAVLQSLPDDHRPFLSHVAFIENALSGKLVGVSDGGLNVELDLEKKIAIMENAIRTLQAIGVAKPLVLLAAGMEDKGQDIPAIADAREIVRRHHAGEWSDAVIDGPFGVDVGLCSEAAAMKGIKTPVAGLADIIITPNLESCNFGVKMMTLATGHPWAGVVAGGSVPMVVGSRSDDADARLCSIAMAQLIAAGLARIDASAGGNG